MRSWIFLGIFIRFSNTTTVARFGSNSSTSGISDGDNALNDTSSPLSASSLKKSLTIPHFGSCKNFSINTTSLQRIYHSPSSFIFLLPIRRFMIIVVLPELELPETTILNGHGQIYYLVLNL